MKKLKKEHLADLRMKMKVMSPSEMMTFVGGKRYEFDRMGNLIGTEDPQQGQKDNVIIIGDQQFQLDGDLGDISQESGVSFSGQNVSSGLFMFLADNTDVEWAYGFNENKEGGALMTSHDKNSVRLKSGFFSGYDSCVHNHAQTMSGLGYPGYQVEEYNDLPSSSDIKTTKHYGIKNNYVYNEISGKWKKYDEYTQTQEDYYDKEMK
ncbi:MAG: JAB-like toxin 1 domain-containing protein [Bacteroidaceae bacterium]|nr:JAB-like toxin 1 domain-containing protein [Prevotellaceae bacterium]MDY5632705.1 JAB-like toxin 1 domain-containing protein [Bacteroidaceae bacterium]